MVYGDVMCRRSIETHTGVSSANSRFGGWWRSWGGGGVGGEDALCACGRKKVLAGSATF